MGDGRLIEQPSCLARGDKGGAMIGGTNDKILDDRFDKLLLGRCRVT